MSTKTLFLAWQDKVRSHQWFPIGRLDADVELPPPPPEVLLEEKQNVTLGNGRDRSTSGGKAPPVVKPKPVRPRNGSTGVPGQPRTSSSSGNT